MPTQHNSAASARWEPRGGALDADTRQQVAELNLRAIGVLVAGLAVAPPAPAEGADCAAPAAVAVAPVARRGVVPAGGRPAAGTSIATTRAAAPLASRAAGGGALARQAGVLPLAVVANGALWRSLGVDAQQSLADTPFLLLELQVARLLARREVASGQVSEAGVGSRVPAMPVTVGWSDLGRVMFQYAWHLSRIAPVLAGFVLGLRQGEVEALRNLGLSRADALAPAAAGCMRLRWEEDAALWADWLAGASRGDPAALWSCQLRGLQRIAGDCRGEPAA